MPLQIRRGTELQRQAMTVPLAAGELLYVTDDQRLYVGNGTTLGGVQITGYTNENAVDAVGAALVAGTHAGITFTYGSTQDIAGRIDATVDLSNYTGTLKADAIKGTIVGDDSTILVDAVSGKINLDGTVKGNIIPNVTEAYDIGSASYRFKDLYLKGTSIFLGNATITNPSGSIVNLPTGSTVAGNAIATTTGNYFGNIVGANSEVLVNTAINKITGNFEGDLTGSIFSDSSVLLLSGIDAYMSNGVVSISDNTIASNLFNGEINISTSTVIANDGIEITTSSATPWFEAFLKNTAGLVPSHFIYSHRGTRAAPTILSAGDDIYAQSFLSYDGATYSASAAVIIQAESVATGNVPATITLATIPNNDPGQAKGLQITLAGLSINQPIGTAPLATLDVNGYAKLAVLNSAPAGATDGMIAIADGTSWDPAGTGKSVMVVYLAGGWRVAATAP